MKLDLYIIILLGPFKCYVTLFFWKLDPPPRNTNDIESYTFVTLFPRKVDNPPPPRHLRYVLEWPHRYTVFCLGRFAGRGALPIFGDALPFLKS